MGDRLPEFLYSAFVNSGREVAGSDVPNWASLSSSERERWEQVAGRARGHMLEQFFGSMRTFEAEHPEDPGSVLIAMHRTWKR